MKISLSSCKWTREENLPGEANVTSSVDFSKSVELKKRSSRGFSRCLDQIDMQIVSKGHLQGSLFCLLRIMNKRTRMVQRQSFWFEIGFGFDAAFHSESSSSLFFLFSSISTSKLCRLLLFVLRSTLKILLGFFQPYKLI